MSSEFSAEQIDEHFLRPELIETFRGDNRLDVLHVTSSINWSWPLPLWFLEKTSRWTRRVLNLGATCKALVPQRLLPNCSYEELVDIVHYLEPKLVISRSFALRARDLEALSIALPGTVLVQSNHSPNSFMLNNASGAPLEWLENLKLARRAPNCYLSSVSEADISGLSCLAPSGKIQWIPNPCDARIIRPAGHIRDRTTIHIGLSARCNYQKNLKSQIDSVACLALEHKIKFYLFLGHDSADGTREDMRRYAIELLEPLGVEVSALDFVEPETLMTFAHQNLDLFLQVTFDESFGYLNWEMMAQGVITITTPHIDVLGTLTAEPTKVREIVDAMTNAIQNHSALRARSIELAKEVIDRNNTVFDRQIRFLLSQADQGSGS